MENILQGIIIVLGEFAMTGLVARCLTKADETPIPTRKSKYKKGK